MPAVKLLIAAWISTKMMNTITNNEINASQQIRFSWITQLPGSLNEYE